MTHTIDRETLGAHIDGIRRLARTLVYDAAEADDVVQDTMLVALESRSQPARSPRAWLAGVTRNMARRTARSAGRRRRHERGAARPEALPAADEVVIRAAEQSRLLDLVLQLPQPYQTAILLRFVEGLPPRDIARRQGIPVETARTHVKRSLKLLRGRLDEEHGSTEAWCTALAVAACGPVAGAPPVAALPIVAVVAVLVLAIGLAFLLLQPPGGGSPEGVPPVADAPEPTRSSRIATQEPPEREAASAETMPRAPAVGHAGKAPTVSSSVASSPDEGAPGEVRSSPPEPVRALAGARPPAVRKDRLTYADNGYAVLDPARRTGHPNEERLLRALYDGLTILDAETGKPVPGAAERWVRSEDARTWTFHLRPRARWSDDTPVVADDFVRAWVRLLDPFTESPWRGCFRPIAGCAEIVDQSERAAAFSTLGRVLREMKKQNPNGIPGDQLNEVLDESGVRAYLQGIKSRAVVRLRAWPEGDVYPPESIDRARDALKKARKVFKSTWRDAFEALGTKGSGVHAPDARTLVVRTRGVCPYLPELLAGASFLPVHENVETKRALAFEIGGLVGNGPYVLKGRGAKPPLDQPGKRVLSVVELERNDRYVGPRPARFREVLCFTDQGLREDMKQFEEGTLDHVCGSWPEAPAKPFRPTLTRMAGYAERLEPAVLYLRFRCARAPFHTRAARRAFALAIDREALAERLFPRAVPAYRIVPPGVGGRSDGVRAPGFDAAAVRAGRKAAALDDETWVELSYGEQPGMDDLAGGLIRGWKKHLGIEPGWRLDAPSDVPRILRTGRFYCQLDVVRGRADDAATYLDVFDPQRLTSGHGWDDPLFRTLLAAARDPARAMADPDRWLAEVGLPHLDPILRAAEASASRREDLRRALLAGRGAATPRRVRRGSPLPPRATGAGSRRTDSRERHGLAASGLRRLAPLARIMREARVV